MTSTDSKRPLVGSTRPRKETHKLLGPADPSRRLGVTVVVCRSASSPPLPDLTTWHNTPIAQRRALTRQEYVNRYGATDADIDQVHAFAAAYGLTVVESHPGRRTVTLEGTPPQFNAAFGITLNRYEAPFPMPLKAISAHQKEKETPRTQIHHGYDGPIQLPPDLHGIIEAVVGLDDRARSVTAGATAPVAAGAGNDPAGAGFFSAAGLAQQYNFPNPGAKDQTIGVHAPQASGFTPSYLSNDILNTYFPSQVSGYQTAPTINNINLTVSGTTFQNNTALVSGRNLRQSRLRDQRSYPGTHSGHLYLLYRCPRRDRQRLLHAGQRTRLARLSQPRPTARR